MRAVVSLLALSPLCLLAVSAPVLADCPIIDGIQTSPVTVLGQSVCQGSSYVSNPCPATQKSWTGSANCSGTTSEVSSGSPATANSTNGNNGSATYSCTNGTLSDEPTSSSCTASASPTPSPPSPQYNCAPSTTGFGRNGYECHMATDWMAPGETKIYYSSNPQGFVTVVCNGSSGTIMQMTGGDYSQCGPYDCPSTSVEWTYNGKTCSGTLAGKNQSGYSSADDTHGTALYQCLNKTWVRGNANCW